MLEREEIYQRVWGYAMARGDRSVDVFVRKLRQKLEKASPGWRYIHTHFGVGYRFSPEPAVAEGLALEPEMVVGPLPAAVEPPLGPEASADASAAPSQGAAAVSLTRRSHATSGSSSSSRPWSPSSRAVARPRT